MTSPSQSSLQNLQNSFWENYRSQKILIAGFTALTGYSLAKLFNQKKISYSIYDQKIDEKLKKKLQAKKNYCQHFFSKISKKDLLQFDHILLSPGIPRSQLFVRQAIQNNIQVWNDFDFLYPLYKDKIIIGVTGTDGKTTVVKWLEFFFKNNKDAVYLCGNVGVPIAKDYKKLLTCKVVVLELSSYMLEDIKQFRANCSLITNLDKDHLNRYASFDEYAQTKINILKNSLSSDFFLWNIDDPFLKKIQSKKFHCQFLSFSTQNKTADFYFDQSKIYYQKKVCLEKVDLKNNLLNPYNFLIVFIVSFLYQENLHQENLHQKKINKNFSLLKNFTGLEHRLEKVNLEKTDLQIYNDSKATTVQAIHFALTSLQQKSKQQKINLILGGRNKGLDFKSLKKYYNSIDKIYIYGESGQEILKQLKSIFNCQLEQKFENCIKLAFQELSKKNILLLSPGCASQDQFKDYIERGNLFKKKAIAYF